MLVPLLTLFSGLLSSLQGVINNRLGKDLGLPAMILSVSLVQSVIAFVWLKVGGSPLSFGSLVQGRILLAGVLGVLIMSGIAWSILKLGAVTTFGLVIFGQLAFSLFVDFYGLFGVQQKVLTSERILSLALMGLAVFILMRNK